MNRFALLGAFALLACTPSDAPAPTPAPSSATEAQPASEGSASQPTSAPSEPAAAPDEEAAAPARDDGHGHGAAAGVPDNQTASTQHYGAPFTSDEAPISLAQALQTCVNTGTSCKVEGTIERVCQVRGCWFTLAAPDVDRTVRVRMVDYGFFVARNTAGAHVVLEGTLNAEEIPQDLAQHFADDEAAAGTAEARQVAGPEQTFQFMITGAQVTLGS